VRNHIKLGRRNLATKLLGRKQVPCTSLQKQKHICLGMRAFHTNPFSFCLRLLYLENRILKNDQILE